MGEILDRSSLEGRHFSGKFITRLRRTKKKCAKHYNIEEKGKGQPPNIE